MSTGEAVLVALFVTGLPMVLGAVFVSSLSLLVLGAVLLLAVFVAAPLVGSGRGDGGAGDA